MRLASRIFRGLGVEGVKRMPSHAIKFPGKGNAVVTLRDVLNRSPAREAKPPPRRDSNKIPLGTTSEDEFDVIVACATQ